MDAIGDILAGVVQKSLQNREPEDYVDDEGFLCCGKCHDRKQMNDVKLSGRLVRDPELKHTPNGVPVATFSLAVDRKFNREEADFIPIVAWRKTAEFVAKYPEVRQRGTGN